MGIIRNRNMRQSLTVVVSGLIVFVVTSRTEERRSSGVAVVKTRRFKKRIDLEFRRVRESVKEISILSYRVLGSSGDLYLRVNTKVIYKQLTK